MIILAPGKTLYRRLPRAGGFALMVSLLLMAFMLMLMVGLSALLRVETSSTGMLHNRDMARQNALLGLQIALGELQGAAGRDQRVSARADIEGDDVKNPHWTGIWESEPPTVFTGKKPVPPLKAGMDAEDNNLNPSTLKFIKWMVSGNEGTQENYKPGDPLVADFGEGMADGVYLLAAGTLVGRNRPDGTPTAPDGSVAAPRVKVYIDETTYSGHYAWWVGDEGVKAPVLVNKQPKVLNSDAQTNERKAFKLPPASNIGQQSGLPFWDNRNEVVSSAINFDTLSTVVAEDAEQKQAVHARWHDLSPYSRGLLTDVRWGGFRGDLTHAFSTKAVFDRYFNDTDKTYYFVNPDEFRQGERYTAKFPNWDILRDFYNLKDKVGTSGSVNENMPVPIRATGAVYAADDPVFPYITPENLNRADVYHLNSSIYPVLARLQVSIGVRFEERQVDDGSGVMKTVYMPVLLVKPLTGYYNPYNVRVNPGRTAAGDELFTVIRWQFLPVIRLKVGDNAQVEFSMLEVLPSKDRSEVFRDLHMVIPAAELEPGETRFYSLWDDLHRPQIDAEIGAKLSAGPAEEAFSENHGFLQLSLWDARVATEERTLTGLPPVDNPPNYLGLTADELKRLTADTLDTLVEIEVDSKVPAHIWIQYPNDMPFPDGIRAGNRLRQFFLDVTDKNKFQKKIEPATFTVTSALSGGVRNNGNQAIVLTSGMWLRGANEPTAQTRVLVDNNVRGATGKLSWDDLGKDFYLMSLYSGDFNGQQMFGHLGSEPLPDVISDFDRFSGYWGGGSTAGDGGAGRVVLFDVPRDGLISLGAFQHANVGRYYTDPSYIAGNSFVPSRLSDLKLQYTNNYPAFKHHVWDLSYVLNQQLWDSFYFSGMLPTMTQVELDTLVDGGSHLPNHRLKFIGNNAGLLAPEVTSVDPGVDTFYSRASKLAVEGAFNINSTSEEAWKAVLSSSADLRVPVYHSGGANAGKFDAFKTGGKAVFSRLLHPMGGASDGGNDNNFWQGYRVLEAAEVDALAKAIVEQIKERGTPFPSMGDFVNRPLEAPKNNGLGRPGLLQRAIDASGVNDSVPGSGISGQPGPKGVTHNQFNGSHQATAFPGYLTQADILQALGPVLSARSDTFTIRSYGDVVDPVSGRVESRAWCEAVVQRMPAETVGNTDALARDANRRFVIISFRWLDEEEV